MSTSQSLVGIVFIQTLLDTTNLDVLENFLLISFPGDLSLRPLAHDSSCCPGAVVSPGPAGAGLSPPAVGTCLSSDAMSPSVGYTALA